MAVDWLTTEDERILALEGPVVAGHTCKVIELSDAAGLSLEELRPHIGARLDAAPQLRRRLELSVPPRERPAWVDDPAFDIGRHVLELPLGGPVDHDELRDIVAGLMHARLDRARPLWTIHLVPELAGGGAALVLRIHHALADGSTTMRICSAILWEPVAGGGGGPPREAPHRGPRGPSAPQASVSSPTPRATRALDRELRPASGRSPLEARISARRTVAFAGAPLADVGRPAVRGGGRATPRPAGRDDPPQAAGEGAGKHAPAGRWRRRGEPRLILLRRPRRQRGGSDEAARRDPPRDDRAQGRGRRQRAGCPAQPGSAPVRAALPPGGAVVDEPARVRP
ncbi:MAG: hypothetical protein E6G00_06800 [Actinobacteria bacterium]|nr:MAG: hypothetical protein E6G00_06800 [Actinomycetota bacterium]